MLHKNIKITNNNNIIANNGTDLLKLNKSTAMFKRIK